MKRVGLNLLPSSAKFQATRVRWKKRIKKISIVMGMVYVVLGLAVTGWLLVSERINKSIKAEMAGLATRLVPLAARADTSQQIKYQAKVVAGVLANRFEYSRYLMLMRQEIMPSGVKIEKSELMERSGIKIEGLAESREIMDAVEKRMQEINSGKLDNFSQAELKSLSYANGVWRFSMEVKIKK
ncbi:MAG: hypothetical protein WCV93_03395 [Candidatus Shapirobacteria bacterium]